MKVHMRKVPLADDIDAKVIARGNTRGEDLTGFDIASQHDSIYRRGDHQQIDLHLSSFQVRNGGV